MSCYDYFDFVHVQSSKTAKEPWDNLAVAYDDKGLKRRVELLSTLMYGSNSSQYDKMIEHKPSYPSSRVTYQENMFSSYL